jgi:Spy/CpxP family protein refolding chaperone
MKRRLWPVVALGLLSVGVVALGTWRCMGWMVECKMTQGSLWASATWPRMLNLTNEQQSRIQPLEKTFKADANRLQIELTQKQIALCHVLMASGAADPRAARQLVNEINGLQKQRDLAMVDHLLGLKTILNPSQQQKLMTTMMQDVCQGCRSSTGSDKDYCGLCKMMR